MINLVRRALRLVAQTLLISLVASGCGLLSNSSASVCHEQLDGQSVARRWNEQLLGAIRRDTPAPTVHARNLFHTSAAMWDSWAAYDATEQHLFSNQTVGESAVVDEEARDVTISYAAYTILSNRYRNAVGGDVSLGEFRNELVAQCLDVPDREDDSSLSDAALLGIGIANDIIDDTLDDGSFELDSYIDLTYMATNPPLLVAERGIGDVGRPDQWQPLQLQESISQNDQIQVNALQFFIGPHWGSVTPFALAPSSGLPIDPGAPPRFDTDPATYVAAAVEVIEYQQTLDTSSAERRDYGPRSIGNNTLAANDGSGFDVNPVTGEPYAPNEMPVSDFGRVAAEFWADGPSSETPPGHWNTVANEVSDHPKMTFEFRGEGKRLSRLEWDIKLYLSLNGAMHDAAIAAWGAKRVFDSSRPITIVRHLASLGQSSDPDLARYDPNGLPLIDGSIELVTSETVQEHHEGLDPGMIAIRGWAGHQELHGNADEVRWIDGQTWIPYQLDTFVTPSFPGYVSGHSAFSRAGAEVLTEFTGSPYFPDGLGEWVAEPGWLRFDDGPSETVRLQWATYADAADQAGESRLYGGIHIAADDVDGRRVGQTVGQLAVERAFKLFAN